MFLHFLSVHKCDHLNTLSSTFDDSFILNLAGLVLVWFFLKDVS